MRPSAFDSSHDPITSLCRKFRKRALRYFWFFPRVTFLRNTRKAFVQGVSKNQPPQYFSMQGHGNAGALYGDDGMPTVSVSDGVIFPYGSVVFMLSCCTAQQLGPNLVRLGLRAFVGFEDKFVVGMNFPAPFLRAATEFDMAFLSGSTLADAHLRFMDSCYDAAVRLGDMGAQELATAVSQNARSMQSPLNRVDLGDGTVRFWQI